MIIRYGSRLQAAVYRASKGRVGRTWRIGAGFRRPVPTLLLEHRGRNSGKVFTAPLLYLVDADGFVVVASHGGRSRHPQWYLNLLANPHVHIHVGAERKAVTAHVADSAERQRLWKPLTELYADFDSYRSWADREIPVVVLVPRSGT
ncbi:nitroreductase family deazaflavin-dependent oxidoreductase [Nocardia sp. NPDC059091]|uniref:nitroreductase family deazaflavin-dependent oxidoreductase n=1 Tax=unclassified Nocardia TaxID=2637762 RepID=UPI0036AD70FB